MPHLRFAALAGLVGTIGLAAACSVYDESLLNAGGGSGDTTSSGDGGEDGGDGGAGPTTTTAVTGQGSTGTVTTGGGCQTVDDCPGEDTACSIRACTDGTCSIEAEVQGFVLPEQTAGDCVRQVCDGAGGIETENDDGDLPPDDGNECTASACAGGSPGHVVVPEGDPCTQDGGQVCLGDTCVECLGDGDCDASDRCSEANTCVAPQCDDGILNGNETDTDCGGGTCAGCALGDDCDSGTDCLSGSCNVTCQPSCTDGALNNGESDTDCGGLNCAPCAFGRVCQGDDDCAGDYCLANTCQPLMWFSEYVEGSSNNKALEIFSFTAGTVDLEAAVCQLNVYFNGNTVPATHPLSGPVAELETHVACHNDFSSAALCDEFFNNTVNFNGDDAVALVCNGVVLDVIGQIGVDPGTQWGANLTSTADNTLRRKDTVVQGDMTANDPFDPATEWDGFAQDTFDDLGSYL